MTNFSPFEAFEGTIRIIDGPPVHQRTKIKDKYVTYLSVSCEILRPEYADDFVTLMVFGPNVSELEPQLHPEAELPVSGHLKADDGEIEHGRWITRYRLYTYIETLEKPLELPDALIARIIGLD